MRISQFQRKVLAWYRTNKRDLPWKRTKNPYRILVSEVMLQQTQVSRVLGKYRGFLLAFPTLKALAHASDKELLSAWRGLGYWKRAKNLKKTTEIILTEYKGRFPKDIQTLEQLPGIGPYTARAVACFAFENSEPFIDTNIRRVYLHFFFKNKQNVSDKEILKVAREAVWKKDPREWHYALFDYGAQVLKDKSINKRSSHYSRQNPFLGSFRSFRTFALQKLLDNERLKKSSLEEILIRELKKQKAPWLAPEVLSSLLKEKLISESEGWYRIEG